MDFFLDDGLLLDVVEEEELVTTTLLDSSGMDFLLAEDHTEVETCVFGNEELVLPSVMCFRDVLCQMLDPELLSEILDSEDLERLHDLLPTFAEDDEEEKNETLRRLFAGENFRFGNPLDLFGRKLENGWFDPEVTNTRRLFDEAQKAVALKEQQNYYHRLVQEVIVSRQKLLQSANETPPGQPLKILKDLKNEALPNRHLTLDERVRKRYHEQLRFLQDPDLSSADEDPPLSKKQKRKLYVLQNSVGSSLRPVRSTLGQKSSYDLFSQVTGSKNPYEMTEETYRAMMKKHRQLRREGRNLPELTVGKTRLEDIAGRLHTTISNKKLMGQPFEVTQKKSKFDGSSSDEARREAETSKQEIPQKKVSKAKKQSPAKSVSPKKPKAELTEIPTLNETAVKVEIETPEVAKPAPSLTQDTHACFFSLLQDIFLNHYGSVSVKQFEEALVVWNSSPITPLNEWYSSLISLQQRFGGWTAVVQSALDFMVQQNLVENDPNEGTFSWSAASESEAVLTDLCSLWLQLQQPRIEPLDLPMPQEEAAPVDTTDSLMLNSNQDSSLSLGAGIDTGDEGAESAAFLESADIIHPPRCVTSWVVRPSSVEERATYQEQERLRYQQPHKAFTFRQHGYESIVGPVKGVYGQASGNAQASTKARGHTLMVPDRPACVTLLALVRDAAARLPNGEGTRAEICELLKDSQYLACGADASLNSVVSGALDRLHYEADPCVKYDAARKVWIYLHRNRTEAEFEQIHKQQQGMPSRAKKPRGEQRRSAGAAATKVPKQTAVVAATATANATAVESISTTPVEPSQQPAVLANPPTATAVSFQTSAAVPAIAAAATVVETQQQPAKIVKPATPVQNFVVASPRSPAPSAAPASSAPAATIQTFQITTSTGVQTIRVAAPSTLPATLLARTLQLSAQQPGGIQGVVQKANSASLGSASVKQVVLTPPSVKAAPISLISAPQRAVQPTTGTISAAAPGTSLIRLATSSSATGQSIRAATAAVAAAARPQTSSVTTVRLAGRQAVANAGGSMQTLLIRPPAPSAGTTVQSSTTPRIVVVNNKMINLATTAQTRVLRPVLATTAPKPTPAVAATAARPVMARLVTTPSQQQPQQQQQVISLENLISLAAQQQKTSNKTGVVQLPLSAIAGLNVAAAGGSNVATSPQGATVLLQGVKGGQSILLPSGLQPGAAINIRNVRVADVSPASAVAQARQTLVTKLITTQQQQAPPSPSVNNSS